jgi:hypothetical protein
LAALPVSDTLKRPGKDGENIGGTTLKRKYLWVILAHTERFILGILPATGRAYEDITRLTFFF